MGRAKPFPQESVVWAALNAAVHGLAWMSVLIVVAILVGKLMGVCADFEIELPVVSQLLFSFGITIRSRWYLAIPLVLVLLAADFGVMLWIDLAGTFRVLGVLWSVMMLAAAVLVLVVALLAFFLPLSNLVDALS